MKATVLVIHGAGMRSHRIMSEKWIPHLKKSLGKDYDVLNPQMPNPNFPQFAPWKEVIRKQLLQVKGPLILIGHSLGGTVLLKYLSEEKVPNQIMGFFMIASPYFGADRGWPIDDFFIQKNPADKFPIYSYHSSDDQIVPVAHQGFITSGLPHTTVRVLNGHGHEFARKEFKEIIEDIRGLGFRSDDVIHL